LSYDYEGTTEANKLRLNGWMDHIEYTNTFQKDKKKTGY